MRETKETAVAFEGGWLTLDETIKKLGKSVSTIERLAATKAVGSKLQPLPGRKPMRLYCEADVEKYVSLAAAPRLNNRSLAVSPPRPLQLGLVPETISALCEAMTQWGNRLPLSEKPWLSLEESAAYSGLGAGYLKQQVEAIEDRGREGRPARRGSPPAHEPGGV